MKLKEGQKVTIWNRGQNYIATGAEFEGELVSREICLDASGKERKTEDYEIWNVRKPTVKIGRGREIGGEIVRRRVYYADCGMSPTNPEPWKKPETPEERKLKSTSGKSLA